MLNFFICNLFARFVSITLVFVNKSLLSGSEKLDAPLFVTCYQCIVTVAACYLLRYASYLKKYSDNFYDARNVSITFDFCF